MPHLYDNHSFKQQNLPILGSPITCLQSHTSSNMIGWNENEARKCDMSPPNSFVIMDLVKKSIRKKKSLDQLVGHIFWHPWTRRTSLPSLTLWMEVFSPFSGPSSESEQVKASPRTSGGAGRGRCSGWKVSWVVSRLLTALSEVQVLGGSEGLASRSVMRPWASPITAMSTVTVVPEDWGGINNAQKY